MKIKHLLAALAVSSVLLMSACSTSDTAGKKPAPTAPETNTPTATPGNYEGEERTYSELLAAVQAADPSSNWVENKETKHWMPGAEFFLSSKTSCSLAFFPSFQDAVDNDSGSFYDSWTTLGLYGQLGVILNETGNCVENLSEVIRFPSFPSPDQDFAVLTASKENIKDCLERKSACLLDAGEKLPGRDDSSFNKTLIELESLSGAGFCDLAFPTGDVGGRDSCEVTSENVGVELGTYITEDTTDLAVLRLAAKIPSKTDGVGKYMIYGDGWVVFMWESTDAHKKLFQDMNKELKGSLVERY